MKTTCSDGLMIPAATLLKRDNYNNGRGTPPQDKKALQWANVASELKSRQQLVAKVREHGRFSSFHAYLNGWKSALCSLEYFRDHKR